MPFWSRASTTRKRIYTMLFFIAVGFLLMALGSLVPVSQQTAQQITAPLNQTLNQNQAAGTLPQAIFFNNFRICLIMFIPIFGPAFGCLSFFVSGYALGAISTLQGRPPLLNFSLLLITPHTWLEFIAYALAISESIWLLRRLTQGKISELKNTAILIGVCAGLLALAAVVETWLISIGV